MDMPIAAHDIDYAEDLLAEGELDTARMLLEELAAEAGEYADTACIATEHANGSALPTRSSVLPIVAWSRIPASSRR